MRKALFTLLAACFVLGGCTKSGSAMSTTVAADPAIIYTTAEETKTEAASAQTEETNALQEETKAQEEEVKSSEGQDSDISGIIMLIHNYTKFTIISINPDTGEEKTIATFRLDDYTKRWDSDVIAYYPMQRNSYSNLRDRFSSDFSKMVATKYFAETNTGHAGWVDTSGKFFDVTEALGEAAKSDFDIPQSYCGYGFTDNGLFAYCLIESQNDALGTTYRYRYAPLDNLTEGASWEINSYDDYIYHPERFAAGAKPLIDCMRPTDWIDDSHVIIDNLWVHNGVRSLNTSNPIKSVIFNLEDNSETEYIPGGNSRSNWSGVISPDGNMVAFLSQPATGNGNTKLYKMPLSGGDPVNVPLASETKIQSPNTNSIICTLLDWR